MFSQADRRCDSSRAVAVASGITLSVKTCISRLATALPVAPEGSCSAPLGPVLVLRAALAVDDLRASASTVSVSPRARATRAHAMTAFFLVFSCLSALARFYRENRWNPDIFRVNSDIFRVNSDIFRVLSTKTMTRTKVVRNKF